MNISVTVGILILTVFLALSAPAYAGTDAAYVVYDSANHPDGTLAADGELVTIHKLGDPLNNTTVLVGSSFGNDGWWKANMYNVPTSLVDGDTIVVTVLGESTTHVIDTSLEGKGGRWLSDVSVPPATGDGDGSGSGSGSGTYLPTPTATPAPTATSEPTVTATDAPTGAPTEAPPKDSTSTQTKLETEFKTQSTPGFGAVSTVFVIAGMLATYLVMRRRE